MSTWGAGIYGSASIPLSAHPNPQTWHRPAQNLQVADTKPQRTPARLDLRSVLHATSSSLAYRRSNVPTTNDVGGKRKFQVPILHLSSATNTLAYTSNYMLITAKTLWSQNVPTTIDVGGKRKFQAPILHLSSATNTLAYTSHYMLITAKALWSQAYGFDQG